MKDLKIVFMGTPDFAVASLKKLFDNDYNVVGVITAPDKQAGRGLQLSESAVKKFALARDLKVLQPLKLKDQDFINDLKALQADVQIVVAFRMLPEVVWNMPPMGTINVHASLLPKYRGAAPINWAIINGEKETGVTTFKLQHQIDTGNILLQEKTSIEDNENAGALHDKLKELGADVLLRTLQLLNDGTLVENPQDLQKNSAFHAPKIFTETCVINWHQPVQNTYDLIRGLSPYPTAFSTLKGKQLKIFSCRKEELKHNVTPGEFESDTKTYLKFAGTDGFIIVDELQLEGKKRMTTTDFLRGYRF
ncbi:MAG: methionyl-tRNA formyltransferase [Ginsengibacter sp.]